MRKSVAMATPPHTIVGLRPHLSIQICAGIVETTRTMPDTPEARKVAVVPLKVEEKMMGEK